MARPLFLVALALVVILGWGATAGANMAKWWHEGEDHGPLVPRNDANIAVDSEDLVFDVAPSLDHAAVTATYRMTNAASSPTTAEVAFVVVVDDEPRRAGAAQAKIAIDGAPVTSRLIEIADVLEPMLEAWYAHPTRSCDGDCSWLRNWARTRHATEPSEISLHREAAFGVAQQVLPDEVERLYAGWSRIRPDRPLSWLVFEIAFPAGASRTVTVAYEHFAGSDASLAVNDVFRYHYLLSPASRWAHFGTLHVTVRAPRKTDVVSSIPLARADGPSGASYETSVPKLPAGELSLDLMSRDRVLFGMTQPLGYWLLVLAAMLALTFRTSRWFGRTIAGTGTKWPILWSVLLVGPAVLIATIGLVALASFAFPPHAFGYGYGGPLGLMAAIAFFTLAAIHASAIIALRLRRSG
jgi:hypothetical protein